MGNINENEIRTNAHLFVVSTETSFITCEMTVSLVQKWKDYGKPLFMIPKDFKERILGSAMDQEIKLNYLKWLT